MTYESNMVNLRRAYDLDASRRNEAVIEPWKIAERDQFLTRLRTAGCRSLLEVGSGPGVHAQYFQAEGLDVTCTDLSPEHVSLCLAKGLKAHVMDFLSLDFAGHTFDAAFALNCLLHVPHDDFATALTQIGRALQPAGLFYLGQYGGFDFEGVWAEDTYEPKRFFAYFTDEELSERVADLFEILDFHPVQVENGRGGFHFQALTLRRRTALASGSLDGRLIAER